MAADGVKKQSLLDQLTAAASAQPTAPSSDSPTPLADAPATTEGSIANRESQGSNPGADVDALRAEQAQSNPSFLTKLKNFAGGAFGLEDPTSNKQAGEGAKVMRLIGGAGNALASAAGTPEQKEIAQQQNEMPLKLAQIKNEQDYRNALIGTKNNANDINQQKADQQKQVADSKMRLKGYVPDEESPGSYRVMSEDEILQDPILSQNQSLAQAAMASKNAGAALALARREALLDPNSPTLQLKKQQIENTYKLAQAHLGVQLHNQTRQDQEFLYNYGQEVGTSPTGAPQANGTAPKQANGVTAEEEATAAGSPGGLTLKNAPDSMLVNPRTGLPIPNKMLSTLKPTPDEQKRADFAMSAIHSVDAIAALVQKAEANIGPVQGRLADYMARAGFGDQFNQELQNYVRFAQSAATAAHTGRFSVPILEKMDKMISANMEASQLVGAIDSVKNVMGQYADAGWKPTVAEYREAISNSRPMKTPSGNNIPTNPTNKTKSFADWQAEQAAKKKAGSK